MDFRSKAGTLSPIVNQIFKSYFKNDDILSFSHSRIFHDGSRAELWANGLAMEYTYLQSGLTVKTHAPKLYESDGKFIFLLDKIHSFHDKTKDNYIKHLTEVKELFGFDNTLIIKGNDPLCFEVFCFYGNKNNASVKAWFMNHSARLEGFITDFKKNHQPLIKLAEENRIVKSWVKSDKLRFELTAKERRVGQYYSRGTSAKWIASEMGVKEKTIFNYLESIKDKYMLVDGARRKANLIDKLRMDFALFHD